MAKFKMTTSTFCEIVEQQELLPVIGGIIKDVTALGNVLADFHKVKQKCVSTKHLLKNVYSNLTNMIK